MRITIFLVGLITLTGCTTTQVFPLRENCNPKELPLRRTVTVAKRSEPKTQFEAFLVSADRDSLHLLTTAGADSAHVFACKDIAYLEYTYKDRERARAAKKTAGIAFGVALLVAAVVLCLDEDSDCNKAFGIGGE